MGSEINERPETDGIVSTIITPPQTEKQKGKSLRSLLKEPAYRKKFIHTMWLYCALFMVGFIIAQKGSSFLDLQIITNTDVERASAFFTAGSVGYLVGSMIFGILYDKLSKSLLLFIISTGMAITVGILPFCSPYFLMIAVSFISATFMGGIDTDGNAEIVHAWGSEGRSYMQGLHFSFALGGVISPLVTEPFLAPKSEGNDTIIDSALQTSEEFLSNTTLSAVSLTTNASYSYSINVTTNPTSMLHEGKTTNVYIAFLVAAVFSMLPSLYFLVKYCKEKSAPKMRNAGGEQQSKRDIPLPAFIFTFVVICLFYLLYCAVEDTFAAYLMTFVVTELDWSKTSGSQVTSAYWASFAISRFLGIFFINCLSPVKILCLCCTGVILSLFGFYLVSVYSVHAGVWVFAILEGLSLSIIFPTGLCWIEEEIVKLTGKVASVLMIASSCGTMLNPLILGYLMQQLTPMWYVYLLLGQSIFCFVTLLFLLLFARTYIKRKQQAAVLTLVVNPSEDPTATHQFIEVVNT